MQECRVYLLVNWASRGSKQNINLAYDIEEKIEMPLALGEFDLTGGKMLVVLPLSISLYPPPSPPPPPPPPPPPSPPPLSSSS